MDQSTRDVQQDRERARAAVSEKIDLLERTVWDTVEDVKNKVKQNFDIRYHVQQRPWQMIGLSIAVGYLLGRMTANGTEFGPSYGYGRRSDWGTQESDYQRPAAAPAALESRYAASSEAAERRSSSWILDQFQDEINTLKGAALAALISAVRDLIQTATSSLTEAWANREKSTTERSVSTSAPASSGPTTERGLH